MSINFADHFQNSTTTFMSAEKRDQILQPIKSFCALTQCTIFFFFINKEFAPRNTTFTRQAPDSIYVK